MRPSRAKDIRDARGTRSSLSLKHIFTHHSYCCGRRRGERLLSVRWKAGGVSCAFPCAHATILHAIAALLHGLLKLLLLCVGHDGFPALMGIHHRGAHLLVALAAGAQFRIVLNCVYLLCWSCRDGQHLPAADPGSGSAFWSEMPQYWVLEGVGGLMMLHGTVCALAGLLIG